MGWHPDLPLIAPPRGSLAAARAAVLPRARRPDQVAAYLAEVWRLAPLVRLDPALIAAQAVVETGWFTSAAWVERLNPAGIGVTGGGDRGYAWPDGRAAAQAHVVHLDVYVWGTAPHPLSGDVLAPYHHQDPRRGAVIAAGWAGTVRTVRDLTGRWATDPQYHETIVAAARTIFGEEVTMAPYVLVVAGHRSHGDPGNPREKALTPLLADAYTSAFREAGYRCDWWQRDADHDADPDDTAGNLDTVALGVARHLSAIPGQAVMLDLHFNGPHSPLHVIVPDSRGLVTAYAGGSPPDDGYPNNTLDRQVAAAIALALHEATGLPLYRGRAAEPGVMVEGETGVGLQGYRLAMFAATAPLRERVVRLVIEHGGYDDPPAKDPAFPRRCAQAAVLGVSRALGQAPPRYVNAVPPPLKNGEPYPHRRGATVWLPLGQRRWTALEATPRRRWASADAPEVGPPVRAGETVTFVYAVASGGQLWFVSRGGSRCLAAAFVPKEG